MSYKEIPLLGGVGVTLSDNICEERGLRGISDSICGTTWGEEGMMDRDFVRLLRKVKERLLKVMTIDCFELFIVGLF